MPENVGLRIKQLRGEGVPKKNPTKARLSLIGPLFRCTRTTDIIWTHCLCQDRLAAGFPQDDQTVDLECTSLSAWVESSWLSLSARSCGSQLLFCTGGCPQHRTAAQPDTPRVELSPGTVGRSWGVLESHFHQSIGRRPEQRRRHVIDISPGRLPIPTPHAISQRKRAQSSDIGRVLFIPEPFR